MELILVNTEGEVENIHIFDFFDFDRILKLTEIEIEVSKKENNDMKFLNDKIVAKLTEELTELTDAMIDNETDEIIEESYDVFNTALSTYFYLFGIKNIEVLKNKILKGKSIGSELTLKTTNDLVRMNNSYLHLDTVYQSKTGLKTISEYEELLIEVMSNSLTTALSFERVQDLNDTYLMVKRKLDKWEGKIV